jgi:hypothetical protein
MEKINNNDDGIAAGLGRIDSNSGQPKARHFAGTSPPRKIAVAKISL